MTAAKLLTALLLMTSCGLASAAVFKCKKADGTMEYSDHGCPKEEQVLNVAQFSNGGTVLTDMLAGAFMLGVKSGSTNLARRGGISSKSYECMRNLDKSVLYPFFGDLLRRTLSNSELEDANKFFNSPTGRKFSKVVEAGAYQFVGVNTGGALPAFSEVENRETRRFLQTSAGDKLFAQKLMSSADARAAAIERLQEVGKSCIR